MDPSTAAPDRTVSFGGLEVHWPPGVLEPRPWTLMQSRWAVELVGSVGATELLELCAGAGHIGQEVVRRTGLPIIQVDRDAGACAAATRNAAANGLSELVTIAERSLESLVVEPLGRRFGVVLADPPYLPSEDCGRYPDDPMTAIDGGPDGLQLARAALRAATVHLDRHGLVLLQLAGEHQARALADDDGAVQLLEVRQFDAHRVVASFEHRSQEHAERIRG